MKSCVELLESGDYQSALDSARREIAEGNTFEMGCLAFAHLSLGNYEDSRKIFDEFVEIPPRNTGSYAACGVARWLLARYSEAVNVWLSGLDCQYADAAGGMELPLLLYFAAACQQRVYRIDDATRLLREKTASPRSKNWPGPVGQYLVGQIGEEQLRSMAAHPNALIGRPQEAQTEFYLGAYQALLGNRNAAEEHMRRCASMPKCTTVLERYVAMQELTRSRSTR
jgi:tetratricopeptide (TPR) repeat protein